MVDMLEIEPPVHEVSLANCWESLLGAVSEALLVSAEGRAGTTARLVYASGRATPLLGLRREQLIGRNPLQLFGPLADRHALQRLQHALADDSAACEHLMLGRPGADPVWLEVSHRPLAVGAPDLRVWTLRPLAQQRAAFVALAESEARLAEIGRATSAFTFRATFDREAGRVTGFTPDPHALHLKTAAGATEAMALPPALLGPQGWASLQVAWQDAANRDAALEWVSPLDGSRGVWRVSARPCGTDPLSWEGVWLETTERERMAETLGQTLSELERVTVRQEQLLELERRRVARQLHDELGQLLNAARLELGKLHQQSVQGELRPDTLDRLDELLGRATQSTRQMVRELRPPVLDLGLVAALEALRDEFKHRHGVACRLVTPDEVELPPFAVHAIYRLVEAALDNVQRHAQTGSAQLTLRLLPRALSLSLADNGVGFDTRATPYRSGLQRMRELSLALEAEFSVISRPVAGPGWCWWCPCMGNGHRTYESGRSGVRELRILLADDHAIMRDGLRRLINDEPGLTVVGEASDGDRLLELAAQCPADLVLMDLVMPGPGPIETLRRLNRHHPGLRVLVLTMHREPALAARILRAGAAGFICKDSAYAMVGMALRKIHAGGRFIDPDLVEGVLEASSVSDGGAAHHRLSEREFEILQRIASGQALRGIAEQLSISPKTVSTHKTRLMEKLGVSNAAELLNYAVSSGLVSPKVVAPAVAPVEADWPVLQP